MMFVGVKFSKSTMGLGPHTEPNHDPKVKLMAQSCGAQFVLKDVRGGMSPWTHKYGPNVHPLHSEEPSQTNVGSRMSHTQQERGKGKTSRKEAATAALNARKLLFQPH